EYLAELEKVLPRVFDFRPDVLFYQSGVDALASDRLGRLSLTHAGLSRRDALVFELAKSFAVPAAITLGGGYSEPISLTAEAHGNTFRAAARIFFSSH